MAKRKPEQNLAEQIDRQIDASLVRANGRPPVGANAGGKLDAKFVQMSEVIRGLHDLPRATFKAQLKADLERRASMSTATEKAVPFIPEGFHSVTPYLIVPGAARLIDFLKEAFSADELLRVPKPGTDLIMHAAIKVRGEMLELADAIPPEVPQSPAALWFRVDDVDAAFSSAIRAGAAQISPPSDKEYGARDASFKDVGGDSWYVFAPLGSDSIFQETRGLSVYFHPARSSEMIDFLRNAFDAEQTYRAQSPEGRVHHAQIRVGDSVLGMGDAHGAYQPLPSTLHLYVPDADAAYERALRAGATVIRPLRTEEYGERSGGVLDPFGNRWWIATRTR